ncbi:MAG: HAD-IB family phosphatase [Chloroflexi bacterium]|nr:HAD-IB family phosphatase [Chloroflexota bacterium]
MLVILDFDDTAAVENVARLLLDRFGDGAFSQIQAQYSQGKLPFRDYQESAFRSLPVDVPTLSAYAADAAHLRPGFKEAVEAAKFAGAEISIVSAGLDFYIKPVLDRYGYSGVPVTSVGTGGYRGHATAIQYTYPPLRPDCPTEYAVCKCRVFEAARLAGREVVFVGDGMRSDACAAARASTVFARSRLLDHCRANGIPAQPFDDLYPLAAHIGRAARRKTNGRGPA